jgi:acetyl esterase/lipase
VTLRARRLFTTFLRNSVSYSHLSSIGLLRRVLDLGQVLPTPKDGIVTPVSFKVKRRGLTGFLADADAREDGQRLLTAEWVINRKLWKQMQDEYRRSDASSHVSREQVIYYLHGGAYYVMSAASHRFLTIQISKYTDSRLFAINYRLAPETRFPGALLDALYGYFRLIHDLRIPSENIVLAGDSAGAFAWTASHGLHVCWHCTGAGLCAALLHYLRDEGYPLPSGAVLMSPWVDLTMSCASWETNAVSLSSISL